MEQIHSELATRARRGDVAAAAELNRLVSAYALLRSCEFLEPDPDKPGAFRRKSLPELKADEDTEISKALKPAPPTLASLRAGVFADRWAFESRSADSKK
jgi:hypothetical protein